MPVSTPNRNADPVSLEAFTPPCILRQEGGLFVNLFNNSATLSIIAGEPYSALGYIGIVQKTILPGKMGTFLVDFIVDALLNPAHTGDINEGDLIYWDRDIDGVVPQDPKNGTTAVAGIGCASAAIPVNGMILGRAIGQHYDVPPVDGSGDLLCATDGSKRVRVVRVPGAPTVYGTPNAPA